MNKFILATSVAAISLSAYMLAFKDHNNQLQDLQPQETSFFSQRDIPIIPTSSGSYLASRAAQHRNEWTNAAKYLDEALALANAKKNALRIERSGPVLTGPVTATDISKANQDAGNLKIASAEVGPEGNTNVDRAALALAELKQRVLIFNLGAGNFDAALKQAKEILHDEKNSKLAPEVEYFDRLGFAKALIVVDAFRRNDQETVAKKLPTLAHGAVALSLKPLLKVWHDIEVASHSETKDIKALTKKIMSAGLMPLHEVYALELAGNIEAAQKRMELINKTSETVAATLTTASFYVRHDQTDKAIALVQDLGKRVPDDKEINDLLDDLQSGDALRMEKNPILASLSSHTKGPQYAIAICLYEMAMSHMAGHSEETALLMGQLAYAFTPDLNQVNFLLVDILKQRGSAEQALVILDQFKEDNYGFADAVTARAEILEKMDRKAEAYKVLEDALKTHPDPDIAYHLAGLYRLDQKFPESLSAYEKVEDLTGGKLPERLWSVHYYRGVILSEMDRWDEAEEQLLKARSLNPDNPYILNYLGYSWVDQNINVEEGLKILKTALQLSPHSGFITDSLGWAYYKKGDYKTASDYLEEAAELMPYDPEVNDHLGDLYWKTDRKLEAYYQWQRAIDYAEADNKDHQKIVDRAQEKMASGL